MADIITAIKALLIGFFDLIIAGFKAVVEGLTTIITDPLIVAPAVTLILIVYFRKQIVSTVVRGFKKLFAGA